ncbi:MAG: fatty acid desaturase family protein [Phaeodactylibacter sp.]|nr:fatty acid desaturase family protein [Phaeodactylibacter sp.]MCB9277064.1 fatty acid desaturase family protein [Lewinellaceae bacterium]
MRTFDARELGFRPDPSSLKPLFKIRPWRHAASMFLDWLAIAAAIFICLQYPSPWLYFLTVVAIGARMHALAILMHDATHYRFLKNRKWNDLLSNLFIMYPIFSSIEKYRKNHLAHHQNLNTEDDPDWVAKLGKRAFTFPKSKREFFLTLFSYIILYQGIMDALWFLKRFGGEAEKGSSKPEAPFVKIAFYLALFGGITWLGIWQYYLLFWIVPYLSTFFMFQYIRSVAEHFGGLSYDSLLTSTRTVKPMLIERFFISPHHVGYHLEHHLYPGVPFYNLPKLHALLRQHEGFVEKAHLTKGYAAGLLQELSGEHTHP